MPTQAKTGLEWATRHPPPVGNHPIENSNLDKLSD